MACSNDVEFTRITEGRTQGLQHSDSSYYNERILVKNIAQDYVEQSKIMIAYFDSAGLVNEFLEKPEINYYKMFFYKSTHATRKYFVEKKGSTYNGNKTYLGAISMGRCKNDSTKWEIEIARNVGVADNFDEQGPVTEDEFLQNECNPYWHITDRTSGNELAKYYMKLRDRRKIGSIDKPLNLSLLFRDSGGIGVSLDTIDGNVIETLQYPYSIDIVNDSIIFTRWKIFSKKEYRGKLTDEQHLRIKNMASALNQKYNIGPQGPLGGWTCILEIDNQVHYKQRACDDNPEFSHPAFPSMPKEMVLLFQYIIDLSPFNPF